MLIANCRLSTIETEMSTTHHAVDYKRVYYIVIYNGDFTFLPPIGTTNELIDEATRSQSLVYFVVYHLNL